MNDEQRLQLRFGPYKTPKFEYGDVVQCEVRGEVVIVGMTDSLIPWPLGRPKGMKGRASLVVCDGMVEAVRREAKQAIQHWWGACRSAVWKWRKVLEVPVTNEGNQSVQKPTNLCVNKLARSETSHVACENKSLLFCHRGDII